MMAAVNDAGRVIGEDHANARYLDSDVANVIELRRQGYTYREISRHDGHAHKDAPGLPLGPSAVSVCCRLEGRH